MPYTSHKASSHSTMLAATFQRQVPAREAFNAATSRSCSASAKSTESGDGNCKGSRKIGFLTGIPDGPQTCVNTGAFSAFLQDGREVRTAAKCSPAVFVYVQVSNLKRGLGAPR
jgi:hypothetical protein